MVYVDDISITSDDNEEIQKLKVKLAKVFEIKDLGTLCYFLGITVARSKERIYIFQRKYVLDLLKETRMLGCKRTKNPIDYNHKLSALIDDASVDKDKYQRPVGRLIYLSHIRLDIAYFISVVSQFMHFPLEPHMEEDIVVPKSYFGKRIAIFLKMVIWMIESMTDRRSASNYLQLLYYCWR